MNQTLQQIRNLADRFSGRRGTFELRLDHSQPAMAYLRLPTYPEQWPFGVSRTICLGDLLGPYEGPEVLLDFDEQGVLVGVEFEA